MRAASIDPILQGSHAECGLACGAMVLNFYGIPVTFPQLRRRYPVSQRGTTLRALINLLDDFHLASRPVRVEVADLSALERPSVLHWDFDHFVILERCNSRYATIVDPKIGRRRLEWTAVSNHFTGVALEVLADTRKPRPVTAVKTTLFDLLSGALAKVRGVFGSLVLLTLAINALALALPALLKFTFDTVVPQHRLDLMQSATLAFVFVALSQFAIQSVRARALTHFRRGLSEELSNTLFSSLVWSKSSFFEARSSGTIVTQYRSINAITMTVSEILISRLIDGLAVIIGLAVVFTFDWKVGLTILLTMLGYAVIFKLMQGELRSRLSQAIQSESKEGAFFVETVNSMQTVKLYSKESLRMATWKNIREGVESDLSNFGQYKARMYASLELVTSLGWIAVVYCLVHDLLNDLVTLGIFTALISWTGLLVQKVREIAQALSEVGSLDEHVNRVDDIISSEKEPGFHAPLADFTSPHDLRQEPLRLSGVSFRYDAGGDWLLNQCDFELAPGKMTVVKGESGVGKTTLLKLILGLISGQSGSIMIGDDVLSEAEIAQLRRYCAAVTQNDGLFMGSVRDNISFFDTSPDEEWVERCAQVACIDQFIRSLPMQYNSLVGRDGAGFSAGQVQRMVLARALYRAPQLLVLDEFTSNLDEGTEAAILQNLKSLGVTILTTAHRPNVVKMADQVFEMRAGKVTRVHSA